jgi:hypothetical protein
MRKTFTIGFLAVALLVGAHSSVAGRVASSMWNLGRHLHQSSAQSISPIERLVLSLASTS